MWEFTVTTGVWKHLFLAFLFNMIICMMCNFRYVIEYMCNVLCEYIQVQSKRWSLTLAPPGSFFYVVMWVHFLVHVYAVMWVHFLVHLYGFMWVTFLVHLYGVIWVLFLVHSYGVIWINFLVLLYGVMWLQFLVNLYGVMWVYFLAQSRHEKTRNITAIM